MELDDEDLIEWILNNDCNQIYDIVMIYIKNSLQNLMDLQFSFKVDACVSLLTKLASKESFCEYLSNNKYFYDETIVKGIYLQNSTLFGRLLSYTSWPTDNPDFRE